MLNVHLNDKRKLLTIMVTWEYPPRIIGDLAYLVEKTALGLVQQGMDTYVVTFDDWRTGFEEVNNIKVIRTVNTVHTHISTLTWMLTLNNEFIRVISDLLHKIQQPTVIHAFDWLTIPVAVTIKHVFKNPFVLTLNTIEDHRSGYASTPYNLAIKHIERYGVLEADKVITGSENMKLEVSKTYGVTGDKIQVVPSFDVELASKLIDIYMNVIADYE